MHGKAYGSREKLIYFQADFGSHKDKKTEESEMIKSLDKMVKIIGMIIIPVGAILLIQEWFVLEGGFRSSVISMVAAVLGMIPEGLYMTASIAMVVSAMRLARRDVLVKHEVHRNSCKSRCTLRGQDRYHNRKRDEGRQLSDHRRKP